MWDLIDGIKIGDKGEVCPDPRGRLIAGRDKKLISRSIRGVTPFWNEVRGLKKMVRNIIFIVKSLLLRRQELVRLGLLLV